MGKSWEVRSDYQELCAEARQEISDLGIGPAENPMGIPHIVVQGLQIRDCLTIEWLFRIWLVMHEEAEAQEMHRRIDERSQQTDLPLR